MLKYIWFVTSIHVGNILPILSFSCAKQQETSALMELPEFPPNYCILNFLILNVLQLKTKKSLSYK